MDNEQIALLLISAKTKRESQFAKRLFKLNGVGKNKMKRLIIKTIKKMYNDYYQVEKNKLENNRSYIRPYPLFQSNKEIQRYFDITGYGDYIKINRIKNGEQPSRY